MRLAVVAFWRSSWQRVHVVRGPPALRTGRRPPVLRQPQGPRHAGADQVSRCRWCRIVAASQPRSARPSGSHGTAACRAFQPMDGVRSAARTGARWSLPVQSHCTSSRVRTGHGRLTAANAARASAASCRGSQTSGALPGAHVPRQPRLLALPHCRENMKLPVIPFCACPGDREQVLVAARGRRREAERSGLQALRAFTRPKGEQPPFHPVAVSEAASAAIQAAGVVSPAWPGGGRHASRPGLAYALTRRFIDGQRTRAASMASAVAHGLPRPALPGGRQDQSHNR